MSGAVPKLRFGGFAGEWKTEKLSKGIALISGQHLGPEDYTRHEAGTPYFTGPSDFTNDESALTKWTTAKAKIGLRGDVLITVKGSGVGELMLLELPEIAIGRQLMAIRSNGFAAKLLSHILQGRRETFQALAAGNMIPGLSRDDILSLKVALPDVAEQQKIAAFLGAVDGRLAGLRRAEAALVRFKAGLMQRLFSQKLRFTQDDGSAFPDWEEKRLGDVALVQKGEQVNRDTLSNENAYPVINGGTGPSGFHTEFNTAGETITISEGGNSCGYVAWQNRNFWCGGHCYSVIPRGKGLCKKFLFQALKNDELAIMRLRVGSGLPNIQKGDLSKMTVSFPHPDEQRKIAAALSALDAKIAATALQITKTERFKQGLLQQMFV